MGFSPYPFTWVPAAYRRHASLDPLPECGYAFPDGTEVTTLCGLRLTALRLTALRLTAVTGELAWLWLTCPDCNAKAHELAGIRR